jgi:hypothetical protein
MNAGFYETIKEYLENSNKNEGHGIDCRPFYTQN